MRLYTILILALCVILPQIVHAKGVTVLTSILPQAYLIERICGNHCNVVTIIPENQSPHTYSPSIHDMVKFSHAELFFSMNLLLEKRIIPKLMASNKTMHIVPTLPHLYLKDGHCNHTSHDDHAIHDAGSSDPHFWLSPVKLAKAVPHIAKVLSQQLPAYAHVMELHAKQLLGDIQGLHHQVQKQLLPYKNKRFYVYHPSYAYFAEAYELEQVAIELHGKSPTSKEMGSLLMQMQRDHATTIFINQDTSSRSVSLIATTLGVRVVQINPLHKNVLNTIETIANQIYQSFQVKGISPKVAILRAVR